MTETPVNNLDSAFLGAVADEAYRARRKFPSPIYSMTALTEEVGELARALLHQAAGKATYEQVYAEAVQVATMALRVAVDGDPSIRPTKEYSEP